MITFSSRSVSILKPSSSTLESEPDSVRSNGMVKAAIRSE